LSGTEPYRELAELAEAALAAAEGGRPEQVPALLERAAALREALPDQPDPAARPELERAAAAHERLRVRLGASLEQVRAELGRADRGRQAARSYGAAAAAVARPAQPGGSAQAA
jgi:hypothetical protein